MKNIIIFVLSLMVFAIGYQLQKQKESVSYCREQWDLAHAAAINAIDEKAKTLRTCALTEQDRKIMYSSAVWPAIIRNRSISYFERDHKDCFCLENSYYDGYPKPKIERKK